MIDMNLNKTKLREMAQMSPNTMAKLGKNETISMDIILRICGVLKCDVGDIMETIADEEDSNT